MPNVFYTFCPLTDPSQSTCAATRRSPAAGSRLAGGSATSPLRGAGSSSCFDLALASLLLLLLRHRCRLSAIRIGGC
jgi:hypothetical protein